MKDGVVSIHGREYKTVALRVSEFREQFHHWSIITDLVSASDDVVVMKASVLDDAGRVVGTGYAEEYRASSKINRTSALENAETSAIGRALAACGFAGTEYASADEVAGAIAQQKETEGAAFIMEHNNAVRECFSSIAYIKDGIAQDDVTMVVEAYLELSDEQKRALWVAPSKGGVFTTEERAYLKSNEFNQAKKEALNV